MLEGAAAFLGHTSEALPRPQLDAALPAEALAAAVYLLRNNVEYVRHQMQGTRHARGGSHTCVGCGSCAPVPGRARTHAFQSYRQS
jgi:hypothetical protein